MKQRPILFSTEMVQAILAGRKTQTRRVVKPQPELTESGFKWKGFCYGIGSSDERTNRNFAHAACPYGKPGDVLWVRETWARAIGSEQVTTSEKATAVEISPERFIVFKAESKEETHPEHPEWGKKRWKPSIHMPKDAARIWLRIKDVRVERLQDITGQDAISEGVIFPPHGPSSLLESWGTAKKLFQNLWQSINGPDSWKDNPWVWVVEFDRIEKPEL